MAGRTRSTRRLSIAGRLSGIIHQYVCSAGVVVRTEREGREGVGGLLEDPKNKTDLSLLLPSRLAAAVQVACTS
jgi:hypothetical protein